MTELNNLLENIQNIKINIGNAIENKGQTVTNFASYPNAILNIKVAEGDILLFSNLSEMNNYTNMNEGDLALVYDINTSNLQALWQYTNNNWELAPTRLTANREYVDSAKFWGANGIETGILQVNTNLTNEQVKLKAQVYSDLSELTLDPSVTNLSSAFRDFKLTSFPNFNTSNVTNMSYMFASCTNLKEIPNLDTSNVNNLAGIFMYCFNLVNVPNFNTSNVTDISSMFYYCRNLITLPNLNTSKVTNMVGMCDGCSNLVTIPEFDTSNVVDIKYAFRSCTNLREIHNLNLYKAKNVNELFSSCHKLYSISNINISNAVNASSMFSGCENLINLPLLDMNNVTSMYHIFQGCTNLVNIPEFNISKVTDMDSAFKSCTNLSDASIANITNMLPNANQLSNQYIANIGLNLSRFTNEQLRILNTKGYVDAIAPGPTIQNYYEIQWE